MSLLAQSGTYHLSTIKRRAPASAKSVHHRPRALSSSAQLSPDAAVRLFDDLAREHCPLVRVSLAHFDGFGLGWRLAPNTTTAPAPANLDTHLPHTAPPPPPTPPLPGTACPTASATELPDPSSPPPQPSPDPD
ncbi:hypothetical protein Agub_g15400, partial [Astrephomene gubernaculifera]